MNIDIGHMNKRINSTKQTFTKDFTNINVKLKKGTSVTKPVFMLYNRENNAYKYNVNKCNYLSCTWGYYWIDDIVYEDSQEVIYFYCHRDVLATGREDYIKNCTAYIKYLFNDQTSQHIDDPRFGPDLYLDTNVYNLHLIGTENIFDTFALDLEQMTIFMICKAAGTGSLGGQIGYAMSWSEFNDFMKKWADSFNSNTLDDFISKNVFGTSYRDCVISVYLSPLKWSYLVAQYGSHLINNVIIGNSSITTSEGVAAFINPIYITRTITSYNFESLLPDLVKKYGYEWLKGPKYMTTVLNTPAGSVDISSEIFTDSTALAITAAFEWFSGELVIKVYTRNTNPPEFNNLIGVARCKYGIDMMSYLSYTPGAGDGLGNLVTWGAKSFAKLGAAALSANLAAPTEASTGLTGDALAKRQAEYQGSVNSQMVSTGTGIIGDFPVGNAGKTAGSISLGGSGIAELYCVGDAAQSVRNIYPTAFNILVSCMIPAAFKDEPTGAQTSAYAECYKAFAKKHGYPYNQVKTISDFSKNADRYIECVGADVGYVNDGGTEPTFSYYLTPSEIAEINNFMNTGFFYE